MHEPLTLHAGIAARTAISLALIAGYVDAYSLRTFAVFVSFMSGNTTQSGFMIGQGKFGAALPTLIAILGFLAGSIAGTLLTTSRLPHVRRLLMGAVSISLAAIAGLTAWDWMDAYVCIALLSLNMGILNGTLCQVGGEPVNLTFVTGSLNKCGRHLALALRNERLADAQGPSDTHLRRSCLMAGLWGGFLTGAVMSTLATSAFGANALLLPCVILLAFALFGRDEWERKPPPPW
jgi:uncharacterized membrane protein YoaK (UPF0700 family)